MAHFLSSPPLFGAEAGTSEAVAPALVQAQSFMHWGFLAWAILGALTTVMLMHYHYEKGLPLALRTLLYPLFGERALKGPIGFLGLQVSYGLNTLFGIPDSFATQALVVAGLVMLYTISAMTGLTRGIQLLSKINVVLAAGLLLFMLVFGPTVFIFKCYLAGLGSYLCKVLGSASRVAVPCCTNNGRSRPSSQVQSPTIIEQKAWVQSCHSAFKMHPPFSSQITGVNPRTAAAVMKFSHPAIGTIRRSCPPSFGFR
nr:BCCT family transporter [Pseudophaeobacter profundi]